MRSSALLLPLVLASCAPSDPPVEYTMVSFEQTLEECTTEGSPCARVTLRYPEITEARDEGVRTLLNGGILLPVLQSIDIDGSRETPQALAEELFFYYRRTLKEFPDYSTPWYIDRTAEVVLDSLGILTVHYTEQLFTGGAHPLHQEVYRMFDTRTGERFWLDSLLADGARQRLLALAEREFRRIREIPSGKSLNEAGFWFEKNRFTLNETIGLTHRGVEAVFNPYEIAPYAMGSTHLVIPYDSLGGILGRR